MALEATIAQRVRAGLKARAEEYSAKITVERFSTLVAQNGTLTRMEGAVYKEVNEFLAAVMPDQKGNEKRDAYIATLSTLPVSLLADTLTVFLLRTEGAGRAAWFPQVLEDLGVKMQEAGKAAEIEQLHAYLRNNLDKLPKNHLLPEGVENGIMERISQNVIYGPGSQTWQSAPISNS